MFKKKTVFVLGAGASWHYGYPTAEDLVDSVISMADRLLQYCDRRLQSGQTVQSILNYVVRYCDQDRGAQGAQLAWEGVRNDCKLLMGRLNTVRPLVIDHFLYWNPSLRDIGKLLIAATILECEAVWMSCKRNQNREKLLRNSPKRPRNEDLRIDFSKYKDDWCRFIAHRIVYGCNKSRDSFNNNVNFVTFNYDMSFEYNMFNKLASMDIMDKEDVCSFLGKSRIVHVYGSIYDHIPIDTEFIGVNAFNELGKEFLRVAPWSDVLAPSKLLLDKSWEAAKNIRTIEPADKDENIEELQRARNWIGDADIVYILGYGFDVNNSKRIGLDNAIRISPQLTPDKRVMYTNYGNMNVISKAFAKLMFGAASNFSSDTYIGGDRQYRERSTRDVYGAFESDFDASEDE